jgi:hypothetical protein
MENTENAENITGSTVSKIDQIYISEQGAQDTLYEIWFHLSELIIEKIIKTTNLSEEQANALKLVMLRPNDFNIELT